MKKTIGTLVLLLISYSLFAVDMRDMFIEVRYMDYHCRFTVTDSLVEYRDKYHYLTFDAVTDCAVTIVAYWQEDFFRRFSYHPSQLDLPMEYQVKYRLTEEGDWTIVDRHSLSGGLLLSLLSRIQRFPLEEYRCLQRNEEENSDSP